MDNEPLIKSGLPRYDLIRAQICNELNPRRRPIRGPVP